MAFPTSKDNLMTNQQYIDGTTVVEASHLNNIQTAIDALETKVGIDNSADTNSIDYILNNAGAYIKLQDVQSQGTNPQSAVAAAWTKVNLNTEVIDSGNICALSSSEFTLPAGTYEIESHIYMQDTGLSVTRLYDVTGAAAVAGAVSPTLNNQEGAAYLPAGPCIMNHRFTCASANTYRIEYYAYGTGLLGVKRNVSGDSERFHQVIIKKVG